ncbi:L-seryl-tRNA(Sec) selenium transferase [Corynebacterium doosanense]|uniref:L-seryl-tRNA(Sec) selenium transferase n=1 Tax=Corynebacterium doosanense CAU 212 = DSM 45436 TaxID=558173 RepID=A0A097IF53_9CORY|nr:L-seryl-tRNA(Sec) selenium transferase [Corynebacterium doosanense]AIT60750.1 selenocysteine synthase [Corynebacterium doosanense CAU 212 = DSM 45436]
MVSDPRRRIPRTDVLLDLPEVRAAALSEAGKRSLIDAAQSRARALEIAPEEVAAQVVASLPERASSMTPVINATGVIIHTNIGRAPLSEQAQRALIDAAGYADVEMDLAMGQRSKNRGAGARDALLAAVPEAEDALVVNNGAAALLLATTALAENREVIISRGELIEIGAGFRLPELIESARVTLREVGATNRTHLADYAGAISEDTGAILKVHPSNYLITGFTSSVGVTELRGLDVPLIVDLGSGLLRHDDALPTEPDIAAQLTAGADVVIASGDKLLGGPQAGILLGKADAIARLKRHPLARALRMDKLRLAALEATVAGPDTPVAAALHLDPARYRARTEALAAAVGGEVVDHDGRVGGGGAPEYPLPGFAVRLPAELAPALRTGTPAVLPRVHDGACLVDLRCVPESRDGEVADAIQRAGK